MYRMYENKCDIYIKYSIHKQQLGAYGFPVICLGTSGLVVLIQDLQERCLNAGEGAYVLLSFFWKKKMID